MIPATLRVVARVWKKVKVSQEVAKIWTCPHCKFDSFHEVCEVCGHDRRALLGFIDRRNRWMRLSYLGGIVE